MHPLAKRYHDLCTDFALVKDTRTSLRVNPAKTDDASLVKRLQAKGVMLEKILFLAHGYWYTSHFSLGATPEYLQGYYYLQEAASQVPAEVLGAKPGDLVLDMACAPGGKITQLAAALHGKGTVVGIDNDKRRLLAVRNNVARLGITNAILYEMDARKAAGLGVGFDKVLLDAPCSGNFAAENGWFEKRHVVDFQNRARLQKELLRTAFDVLKPGGAIVYATCSLEPEEDEMVVDWAIEELSAVVEPIALPAGDPGLTMAFHNRMHPSLANTRRFWPHRTGTQGFFVAKMRK